MAVLATAYNLKEGMAELPPGSASVWKLHILYCCFTNVSVI